MVRINWTLTAVEDLKNIRGYIARDSKQYARSRKIKTTSDIQEIL